MIYKPNAMQVYFRGKRIDWDEGGIFVFCSDVFTHCACGAELMGRHREWGQCGECRAKGAGVGSK